MLWLNRLARIKGDDEDHETVALFLWRGSVRVKRAGWVVRTCSGLSWVTMSGCASECFDTLNVSNYVELK